MGTSLAAVAVACARLACGRVANWAMTLPLHHPCDALTHSSYSVLGISLQSAAVHLIPLSDLPVDKLCVFHSINFYSAFIIIAIVYLVLQDFHCHLRYLPVVTIISYDSGHNVTFLSGEERDIRVSLSGLRAKSQDMGRRLPLGFKVL